MRCDCSVHEAGDAADAARTTASPLPHHRYTPEAASEFRLWPAHDVLASSPCSAHMQRVPRQQVREDLQSRAWNRGPGVGQTATFDARSHTPTMALARSCNQEAVPRRRYDGHHTQRYLST